MDLDQILDGMLTAMEENNFFDVEAYAEQIIEYLESDGFLNETVSREFLRDQVQEIRDEAHHLRMKEQRKHDLVDQIIKQSSGVSKERIKLR